MSHVTGVVALIAAMVRAAGTLIVMPTFKARRVPRAGRARAHDAHAAGPAMYNLCLLEPRFENGRPLVPGASAASAARRCRRPPSSAWPRSCRGCKLMNAYGATETTSPATMMPPAETATRLDSVGLAVPCGEVLVMDEEGREVPRGEEGEIWLRGPMVVSGYWNDPEATPGISSPATGDRATSARSTPRAICASSTARRT